MIAFEDETIIRLILGLSPILLSLYFFVKNQEKYLLFFLVLGAFTLRFAMISLDPLHEWDERFHALVAKNMLENPFHPTLIKNPVFSYSYKDWCCNEVWLHKQPLFLWIIALSMKIFGVNEIALRLPAAILGSVSVLLTYLIAIDWFKNKLVAYLSGFLLAVSYFHLELISGRFGLDHNDVLFHFFVTASIWAFSRYRNQKSLIWAIMLGVLVGFAVLVKWLTGILIFGGWGLHILLDKETRYKGESYVHLFFAACVSIVVILPWQIYITLKFPIESSWEYAFNRKHIFEVVEGHSGDIWYHFNNLFTIYGVCAVFIFVGLYFIYVKYKTPLSFIYIAMIVVIYSFFSIVATKMLAFTFPVSSLVWTIVAVGIFHSFELIESKIPGKRLSKFFYIFFLIGLFNFQGNKIVAYRSHFNNQRNQRINNIEIFKSLEFKNPSKVIVLNCKSFENIDFMFYQNQIIAHHWYPSKAVLDKAILEGYEVYAFNNHNNQLLPTYISLNKNVRLLHVNFQ